MACHYADLKPPFVSTSFSNPTARNEVTALVDGDEAMRAMYEAMDAAKKYIYIANWRMDTSVAMGRDETDPQGHTRVGRVLRKMAQNKKVDVRVMLYHSTLAVPLGEEKVLKDLEKAGIKCFSHRPSLTHSHHEKILIVDGKVAFIGGIDLTQGRWDTKEHWVVDPARLFSGDYYNSTLPQAVNGGDSRLPWHDIHCRIEGPAVFDILRTFAERWNNTKPNGVDNIKIDSKARTSGTGNKDVQIVRSLSKKSGSENGHTEHSIQDAYLAAIQTAEHFVYIENQYFISHFGKGPVQNQIMNQLAQRIVLAIRRGEDFLAVLVLPVMPEGGPLSKWKQQEQMHWQFLTLARWNDHNNRVRQGVFPLWQRVQQAAEIAHVSPDKYLSIHSLRGWAKKASTLYTEQVYVHAKMMIVDDRVAIIGSANINDRSMLGDRDSEIAAVIVEAEQIEMVMGGKTYGKATRFAHDLRVKLWCEHLGISEDQKKTIENPIASLGIWKGRSHQNTNAFLTAFPFLPRNAETKLPTKEIQNRRSVFITQQAETALSNVKGHLVDFPLEWLREEDLETTGYSDNIFT